MLEMHFGIFVSLAFLVYYRDWLPIVVAAAVIAVHHLSFFALQSQGAGVFVVQEWQLADHLPARVCTWWWKARS